MKSTDKFVLVLVASLALLLAGCGGGSSTTEEPTDPPAVDPAVAERAAISSAIMMARTAVSGIDNDSTDTEVSAADTAIASARTAIANAANVPAAEKAANTTTVDTLVSQLSSAKMARSEAMDAADKAAAEAMAKVGKALRAALGGPTAGGNALANNEAAPSLAAAGLTINAAAGAGALPATGDGSDPAAVTLKAGDSAGSLGGWTGTDYALTTPSTKVKNEARVYTNRGSPTSAPIAEKEYPAGHNSGTYDRGERSFSLGETADPNIKASAFPTSGSKDFAAGAHSIPGTYDGASGDYKCTSTGEDCTARFTTGGIVLDAGWTFVHDSGAMASTPDGSYLYYGWWVSKDKDGDPTAASAFTGVVGTVAVTEDVAAADFQGKATYVGKAAGKFAMSNPLDGTGNGGHFTADAELNATFGPNHDDDPDGTATGGITGTIDNFRLNDGSTDPGWSVALHRANWGTTGAFATPDTDQTATATVNETLGTTWSINDNASSRTGTWSGQLYDESPATASDDDGSNIPTTATGTFYSEFSAIGRMVGAFGADLED